jgi:hypothetical protein
MAKRGTHLEGDDIEGGYCNPPRARRFRKGQSGNPAGRPKGSKNRGPTSGERLRSLMLDEAYRPIRTNVEGVEVTMPLAQAVVRSLAEAAAKGEARAQAMFFRLVNASEIEEAAYEQVLANEEDAQAPHFQIRIVDPADTGKTK